MKRLILKTLALSNFKGKTFTLTVDGRDAEVFGDNGTGKTGTYDALCWLLFDKDSQFKSSFEIKNLDTAGNAEHNLSHEVKGLFEFDGLAVWLRKVYAEIWTKKRGNPVKEFTGHSTDHYIDGVPVSKKEYQSKISEIATEEQFKLLTSPFYFSEKMKWQERRALLMELCGDVSDAEVIAGNDKLKPLGVILNGRRLDDHKKVIAARRTEINNALGKIPVRIDEVVKGMADISDINLLATRELIESLGADVTKTEANILALENGGGIIALKNELAIAETEALKATNARNTALSHLKGDNDRKITGIKGEFSSIVTLENDNSTAVRKLADERSRLESINSSLRSAWVEEGLDDDKVTIDDSCPCCSQYLPAEQQEAARFSANQKKSKRKEEINRIGGENKKKLDGIAISITEYASHNETLAAKKKVLSDSLFLAEAFDVSTALHMASFNAMVTSTAEEVEQIKLKIMEVQNGDGSVKGKIKAAYDDLDVFKEQITEAHAKIALVEAAQKAEARKVELEAEEKKLAAEFEKLEGELFLMESFIRAKVEMLEGKINSMFSMARFKLFQEQVNGGLSECCSVTYNGVPFETSLNTGAKINTGLDVINTIIKAQGVSLPIFVDNSESVTSLVPVEAQVVQLVVSEQDKTLRVVVK